jgi:hypothetical protein
LRAKVNYILRVQDYTDTEPFREEFDKLLICTFEKILGIKLTKDAEFQARISFSFGGFALGFLKESALCGHFAAQLSFARYLDVDIELQALIRKDISAENILSKELEFFKSQLILPDEHWCSGNNVRHIINAPNSTTGLQHELYDAVLFNDVQAFIEAEGVGALEKARREAFQGFEAGAFLLATPKGDCRFIGSHFQTACTLRLGMEQPFISNNDETCVCGKRLDKKGIHLSRCKRGGEVIDRHDAIVRTLRQLAARAGIKCTRVI